MNGKTLDVGLLVLRVGIGAMFVVHGKDKVFAGPDTWTAIGGMVEPLGFKFAPTFFGAAAAFSEFLGGILIALGLFFRPACVASFFTMAVAVAFHMHKGDSFSSPTGGWAHAALAAVVFLGLAFTGPGKLSVQKG